MSRTQKRGLMNLVLIGAVGILLLSMVVSLCAWLFQPKAKKIELSPQGVYSILPYKNGTYLAATIEGVCVINDDGDVKTSKNLVGYANQLGLDIGDKVYSLHQERGSDNIWAVTSGNYLIRLQEKDGQLKVMDYVALKNGMYDLTEKGNYVYVLEREANFVCLKKFDLTKEFSDPTCLVSSGHLYTPNQSGKEITLKLAKNLAILSFEIIEQNGVEYAYILHADGLLRVSTDCSQNNWKVLFDQALEKACEGKGELDRREIREIGEKIAEELGLHSYSLETGEVRLDSSKINKNLYNNYSADEVSYSGCAYIEEEGKYYITTFDKNMIVCDAMQDFSGFNKRPIFHLPFRHEELGIELEAYPTSMRAALVYDKAHNIAYVLHSSAIEHGTSVGISRVDLNTKEAVYLGILGDGVSSVVPCADGESIFYRALDEEIDTGSFSLYRIATQDIAKQAFMGEILYFALVVALFAGIIIAICIACKVILMFLGA